MKITSLLVLCALALAACATGDGCIHVNPSPYGVPDGAAITGAGSE